ncbi:MAG: hypothetical protein ACM3SM_00705 [Bacteroidota bacterium]
MKKLLLLFLFSCVLRAQSFDVDKISGKVYYFRGAGDNMQELHTGDKLSAGDMLLTMDNSSVLISRGGQEFLLRSNSVLGMNTLRKISLDELLLALAMEEIRNVPRPKGRKDIKSTAVYGADAGASKATAVSRGLGEKRINGARQLADNGYRETSIIFARETFRKYPETRNNVSDRIYFAEIMEKLNLPEEAYNEYSSISTLDISQSERQQIDQKMKKLSVKLQKKSLK